MTIKEITALRKSGRLQEALEAAETEFSNSKNIYTVSTLFWCLNDLYKQQDPAEAAYTINRMEDLFADYGEEDEMMGACLLRAQKTLNPIHNEIQAALKIAKEGGKFSETFKKVYDNFQSGMLDNHLYSDFGWLIYYMLKNTDLNDSLTRKRLLHTYLQLSLPTPSILHSRILGEAIKVEKSTPLQFNIRDFIRLWDLNNLMEDDWTQFTTDNGHTVSSMVEKLITVYAKEIKTDKIEAPAEFCQLVDKALVRYPHNQNMPYYKAITLISKGQRNEAITYYKKLLLTNSSKQYLWLQLSELVDDEETKAGLLCKALSTGVEDKFLGGIRLRLARLLLQRGMTPNAAYELKKYEDTYRAEGWSLKGEYYELLQQVSGIEPVASNKDIYNKFCASGDTFIYDSLPSKTAVKVSEKLIDDKNRPGKKIMQWFLQTGSDILRLKKPSRYGFRKLENGSVFKVKVHDKKIVWIKQMDNLPSDEHWIKELEGIVKIRKDRNERNYAIIEGAYIPANLLSDVSDGQQVKIRAVRKEDGRWSAISLSKL